MIIIILLVVGLALGSFVNALAWRLQNKRDWVRERSECIHCHHQLAWNDLMPVLSWLLLRGKCRYCKQPIDDSPITELVTAILFVVSYAFWPYELSELGWGIFGIWLVIIVGFMVMSLTDLKWMKLPNNLTLIFTAVTGILMVMTGLHTGDWGRIVGGLIGGLSLSAIFFVLFQASGGKWIGGGDVKLAFMLGILAGGFIESLLLLFLASALGTLIVAPLLIAKKKKLTQRIPFGPFLMAATIIVYLVGIDIINWYQNLLTI